MNPLLKKEIRLLLPVWLAVLLLEMVAPWLTNEPDLLCLFAPVFLFFGIILLSVDSFGREFSLGTFSSLMSQPVDRQRLWQTKITLLLAAAALVFAVYFASCELRLHLAITDGRSVWHFNPKIISQDYAQAMLASVAVVFVALTGGLWTALLLRQAAAAFWITLMTPVGLLLLIELTMSQTLKFVSERIVEGVLYGAAGLYIAASFWLAHRLFFRAQDAGWSGGVISFDRWRYFEKAGQDGDSQRRYRPVTALLKKEFQLNSISFFCAGALLAVHGVVLYFRMFYTKAHPNTTAAEAADYFWVMWLVMPLVISCTTVAEERKLGVADSQLCLPVSRRRQFALKFIPTMVLGVLLGGVMPLLLENLASRLGVTSDSFKPGSHPNTDFGDGLLWFQISLLIQAAGLAAAGFLASTVARNFLQALSIAIVGIIGIYLIGPFLIATHHLSWLIILGVPVMSVTLVWLMYRTFSYYHEGSRLWWRYLAVVLGAWVLVHVGGDLIYNRIWDRLTLLEPAHGPARWTAGQQPVVLPDEWGNNLLLKLPDGRVWFGYVAPNHRRWIRNEALWTLGHNLLQPPPFRLAHAQFIAGNDWASATAGSVAYEEYPEYMSYADEMQTNHDYHYFHSLETVAVRTDGTLWVSEKPSLTPWNTNRLMQFGSETNWQQVARNHFVFLLKKDGTLWCWGPHGFNYYLPDSWPGLRAFQPRQIGTNTGWQALLDVSYEVQKRDGSVWNVSIDPKTGRPDFEPVTNSFALSFDRRDAGKLTASPWDNVQAGIRRDGTLWIMGRLHWDAAHDRDQNEVLQSSGETNWTTVAVAGRCMVAMKADGTLWRWGGGQYAQQYAEAWTGAPQRLGIHQDWVALLQTHEGVISVAADGSLWFWLDNDDYGDPWKLTKPSDKPVLLGNILAAN